MNKKQLDESALWTALITPFDQQLNIDYESLTRLLKMQEKAGNGILILGSTGENLSFSEQEKQEIVKFVCAQKLKVPIMVGVGGFHLDQTLQWLDFCADYPINAYLLVTPLYTKPGIKGQKKWFEALLNKATKPCMLYNVPSRTGVDISKEALIELAQHPQFWSIKEASGLITEFEIFHQQLPHISLFSGEDALIAYQSLCGAKGIVSVLSNIWPEEMNRYTQQCLKRSCNAKDILLWKEAAHFCFHTTNPIPAKNALFQNKMISFPNLRPPLTHEEIKFPQEFLKINDKIKNWSKN